MMEIVILLILSLLFIIADTPYLILTGAKWKDHVAQIQGAEMSVDFRAAAITYVFLAVGLRYLVLTRELSLAETTLYAGLWGFTTYGVFNFTNLAILKNYDKGVAVMDTMWGATLSMAVAFIAKKYIV